MFNCFINLDLIIYYYHFNNKDPQIFIFDFKQKINFYNHGIRNPKRQTGENISDTQPIW